MFYNNIGDFMELISLSKIKYKNNNYQIFSDLNGYRYFYLLKNDEYKEIDFKTNIELSKIFNNSFNRKLYLNNRKIIDTITICSATLGVITLYGMYAYCKLHKDFFYKNILLKNSKNVTYEEIIDYVDVDKDLELDEILNNNEKIDEQFYPFIESYVDKFEDEDLTLFYYNLQDMEIKAVDEDDVKREAGKKCAGYYDITNNIIVFSDDVCMNEVKDVLYHEFRHASKSTSVIVDNTLYYNTFNVTKKNVTYGTAVLEGMNAKYTDYIDPSSLSYPIQQVYADMLIDIFGEEKMKEIEAYGNADTLIDELSNITGTKEDAKRLIMMMDDELEATSNNIEISTDTSIEIKQLLSTYFLQNEQNKLMNSDKNNYILNYISYINNCNEFKNNFYNYYTRSSITYTYFEFDNNKDYQTISNWFNIEEKRYAEPFLEMYVIDEDVINDLNTYIFVDEINTNIETDNSNIKCYKSVDDTYLLHVTKAYLLYGNKEELLKYISEDKLNEVLDNIKEKHR